MKLDGLEATDKALVAEGKGILADDEMMGTLTKLFESPKIGSTEQYCRNDRKLVFPSPGVSECISGLRMYDETTRQNTQGNSASIAERDKGEHHMPALKQCPCEETVENQSRGLRGEEGQA